VDVDFEARKLADLCNSEKALIATFGKNVAKKVGRRLQDLLSQERLEDMRHLPGNCHELKGNRAGQLALEVSGSHRLVFRPSDDPRPTKPDGGLDWKQVEGVTILAIEDYH
jgi:plasmid maintenance system killer protein